VRSNKPAASSPRVRLLVRVLASLFAGLGSGIAPAAPPLAAGTVPVPIQAGNPLAPAGTVWNTNGSTLVNTPTATGVNQVINQSVGASIYNWQTFNIANGSSVHFNMQTGSAGRALNRVWDPAANPSIIQGRLSSNGQVYLLNQNGILFDGTAQVNTGALVAAALGMSDNEFLKGLPSLSNRDPAFSFSGTDINLSNVVVEGGANLRTPSGGRVMLLAARQVENRGSISTPDGQTVLAAGPQIYLAAPEDANLRGLLIEVGAAGDPARGTATNAGVIETPRGNTSIVGYFVNQSGRVSATTSVTANGSIYLRARDSVDPPTTTDGVPPPKRAGRGGELVLGAGSVTEVTADSDAATIKDSQTFNRSVVDLSGALVHLKGGATVSAPGGNITVQARANPGGATGTSLEGIAANAARLIVEDGALISTAGLRDVGVAMERNVITTEILGASDFADAPLQRNGVLYRKRVSFDARKPVPILGDTTKYKNEGILRGAAEKLSSGGSITLVSEGLAALAEGATLDVSGGSIRYADGNITTTTLTSQGRLYGINSAAKDLVYDGVAGTFTQTSNRFGVTETFGASPLGTFERGYVEGARAGSIAMAARTLSSNATLKGDVVSGPLQRDAATRPAGGSLNVGDGSRLSQALPDLAGADLRLAASGVALDAGFWAAPATAAATIGGGTISETVLDTATLRTGGFSSLGLYSNGSIRQDAAAGLTLSPGGTLKAGAAAIDLQGSVAIRGGAVDLTTKTTGGPNGQTGADIRLGGSVDVAGGWVNDAVLATGGVAQTAPLVTGGGKVSFKSEQGIILEAASAVDVSAGARLGSDNRVSAGSAGSIALLSNAARAADERALGIVAPGSLLAPTGQVRLDGSLRGAGFGKGGSLTVVAPKLRIGANAGADELGLGSGLFGAGGFSDLTLVGIDGLAITAGTVLTPRTQSLMLDGAYTSKVTGSDLAGFTRLAGLPDATRAPVNLKLGATGSANGRVVLETGAAILADTGASVTLAGGRQVTIEGRISAPAGKVNIALQADDSSLPFDAGRSLWFGDTSSVSVAGVFKPAATPGNGLVRGEVQDGGSITLNAVSDKDISAFVVARAGANFDLRGAVATLDLVPQTIGAGSAPVPTAIGSKGGTLAINALDGLMFDATVNAAGGTPTSAGGRLAVSIAGLRQAQTDGAVTNAQRVPGNRLGIELSPAGDAVPAGLLPGAAIDRTVHGGVAKLRNDRLAAAGFSELALAAENSIGATAPVTLAAQRSVTLDTPVVAVAGAARLDISAPYVSIGSTGRNALDASPATAGAGALAVAAQMIDLEGKVALAGIGSAAFNSSGDIRFKGYALEADPDGAAATRLQGALNVAGDVGFTSAQAYPATFSNFRVSATGNVAFAGNGSVAAAPLSAGGRLAVDAANIDVTGSVRAPLGTVALAATGSLDLRAGSLVSVSGADQLVPYGRTENGLQWVYAPGAGRDARIISAPAAKRVDLKGQNVNLAAGSTVDLAGGGDMLAYEFVPGTGGSNDILLGKGLGPDGKAAEMYAILPGLGQARAPWDAQIANEVSALAAASDARPGDTITIGAGSALAAGTYTLLPARYALMPGAFAVRRVAGYQDAQLGRSASAADGSTVVAGYRGVAGTALREARTSGWAVTPGATLRSQAEYKESRGDAFFADAARAQGSAVPRLAQDAGLLAISAAQQLALDGTLGFSAPAGRGGALDIASAKIAVTDGTPAPTGFLALSATALNASGIESLMLGGRRDSGVVTASDIVVDSAATPLLLPDVVLAATSRVEVRDGSAILARPLARAADAIAVSGDGALVRVTGNADAPVARTGVTRLAGTLAVGENSRLGRPSGDPGGATSVVLDGTFDTTLGASASVAASHASLAGSRVSAGAVPTGTAGVVLGAQLLSQLGSANSLTLRSYSGIDFHGSTTLGGASLDNLTLDAPGLISRGQPGDTANVTARQITLTNTTGLTNSDAPSAGGSLNVTSSGALVLGDGAKAVRGFTSVNLSASGDALLANSRGAVGSLEVSSTGTAPASLAIHSARITGTTGANQSISASGAVEIGSAGAAAQGATDGVGARLAVTGQRVRQAGTIDLGGGTVRLEATGSGADDDVVLAQGSVTRAAGVTRLFDAVARLVGAGRVDLASRAGSVTQEAGARLDVSGAGGGAAGDVSVSAVNGVVTLGGEATGTAGGAARGARVSIDARTLGNFDALNSALNAGGFSEERSFRARSGNISQDAAAVASRNVAIAADAGAVSIGGTLGGTYEKAGSVKISGRDGVSIDTGAQVRAAASGALQRGGDVIISTTAGTTGNLNLAGGSIDTGGGAGAAAGDVWLRATRTGAGAGNEVGTVAAIGSSVTGASKVIVEGVQRLDFGTANVTLRNTNNARTATTLDIGTGATPESGTVLGDARGFMSAATAIQNRIGAAGATPVELRPGIEVRTSGDITVGSVAGTGAATPINLYAANRPELRGGVLSLAAGGNVNLANTISDGFNGTATTSVLQVGDASGQSLAPTWSYRITGGADLAAAQPGQTNSASSGDVVIGRTAGATDVLLRTATGRIEINAARNVQLLNSAAAIYTTGAGTTLAQVNNVTNPVGNTFASGGGAIDIAAGNDVIGAISNQMVSNWLYRRQTTTELNPQTAWWARYDNFRQGVATFGGGDIAITAGNDVRNVSASVATNARLPGTSAGSAALVVQGGGDLDVRAGRDIGSGTWHVGRGAGTLVAGRDITTTRTQGAAQVGTVLALQDASFDIQAGRDLRIDGVFNPTMLVQATNNAGNASARTAFSTYGQEAAIRATAVSGSLDLRNATDTLRQVAISTTSAVAGLPVNASGDSLGSNAFATYPGSLDATAITGSLSLGQTNLMPAARGRLNLIAGTDVGAAQGIVMSDNAPASVRSATNATASSLARLFNPRIAAGHDPAVLHADDPDPVRIVAASGDVSGVFNLPKAVRLIAGRDVRTLTLFGQNISASDTTLIRAGRDFDASQGGLVEIGGPGQVFLQAGRNVDLGISAGVVTRGNLVNPYLPEAGASLTVVAGVGGSPDYTAAAARYLPQYGVLAATLLRLGEAGLAQYLPEVTQFVRARGGADAALDTQAALRRFLGLDAATQQGLLDRLGARDEFIASLPGFAGLLADYRAGPSQVEDAARAAFTALPAQQQQPLLNRILGAELTISGSTAARAAGDPAARDASYARGTEAIATFFPDAQYRGDLLMYSSQIKTERGGDINLFVPGGLANAGLPVPSTGKGANELGIVTVGGGDINAMVRDDFLVNQSRVFTLAGGNILIWSAEGNIDAGRGAKTAASAPPPRIFIDSSGNVQTDISGSVSGSGIGTLQTRAGTPPSDVTLAAPKGEINAGDAGIRSTGNFDSAAIRFVGADNVQVKGDSAGVPPPASVGSNASASLVTPGGDASRAAAEQATAAAQTRTPDARQAITSNQFLGFGE
jgi:filamentous hemagglutinin family protein